MINTGLIVILFIYASALPSLLEAQKYYKKDLKILDDTYSVGIWDLKFNEELYGYQGFGSSECFSNTSCYPNLLCKPCDWTDPLVCSGQIRGINSTCPCGTPPLMCFPSKYPYLFVPWAKDSDSVMLEIFDGGITDTAYHPNPPNNCSCIIFKIDVLEGSIQGILLYYGEKWLGNSGPSVLSRHGTSTVCPSNPRWGQSHLPRIIGSGKKVPYARVKISIQYEDVSSTVHLSSCNTSAPSSMHTCLPTNIFTKLSPVPGTNYIRVSIDPPSTQRCGVVGFWATSGEHLLSKDPWVSPQNSTNAFRTHRENSPDGRPWPSIYSYCLEPQERLYAFVLSSVPVDFFIDTAKEWMILRPFSDFAPPDFFKRFLGAVTAICPNNNFTAHRTTYAFSETMNTGSTNLRMVFPSDDVDIFYPPPLFASDPYYLVSGVSTLPIDSNRIIVSLLLDQRLTTRSQPLVWTQPWFPNAYQWLTIDEWENCTLSIGSMITDANGIGLNLNIIQNDITVGLSDCDPELYASASQIIDEIQGETTDLVSQTDADLPYVYKSWFLQDRIASSNAFYSCRQKMQSFYIISSVPAKSVRTDRCVLPFGTDEFDNDDCCRLDKITLYDTCLVEDRTIPNQYEIKEYTDEIKDCPTKECAQASLTNLVIQLNLDRDPTACANSVDRPADQNVYWKCIHKIWGPEPITFAGPNCTHDVDCPGSSCNVYSKRCFVTVVQSEPILISCIYDGLSQFTRTFVSNELNLDPADPNIKALWLNRFSTNLPCRDNYIPVGFDVHYASYGKCHGCDRFIPGTKEFTNTWAFSPGTSWPGFGHDCWAPGSASCNAITLPFGAKNFCAIKGCNNIGYEDHAYFPFLSSPSLCINNTFCGISDDNFFYNDVTNVIPLTNCNNATLCILANGTKLQTNTASECKAILSCDVSCNGLPCLNKAECANSGSCSDSTDYDIAIWARIYAQETGGCFFTIRYRDPFNPTASVCEPPFRNTIIGCSVYPGPSGLQGGLFQINQSSCASGKFQWGDPSIFELINPRWISPAQTESQCLNYGNVCDDPIHSYPAAVATYTNTFTFNDKCLTSRQLFKWRPGRWLPGQPRNTSVVVGKLSTRFQNSSRLGLDLPKILANLTRAVDKLQSLKVHAISFCQSAYKHSLDELICSCVTGYNESFCYTQKEKIISIGIACDEPSTVSAGDLQIVLTKTSLPPATCDNLFFTSSSVVLYKSRTITPLRTLLVNYAEDSEFAIHNNQLGIYGKVLTNGYSANFSTDIVNITICIGVSVLRRDYQSQSDKYPILDIAKRSIDSFPDDLVPLNLPVTINNGTATFCIKMVRLEPNQLYYFIQRADQNYTTVERSVFSSGEIAYISVLLALYCLGLIAVTVKFIYLLYVTWIGENGFGYAPKRLVCVLFFIWSFFVFRVILFSLLLNRGLLGLTSSRAVNYLLFEFPIILYYSFVTNYTGIWITMLVLMNDVHVIGTKFQERLNQTNSISIFFNIVIFIVFIIVIILFQTIVPAPHFICGGSILLFSTDTGYALLLAYRIIFSTIAIVLGFTLFVAAFKMAYLMSVDIALKPLFGVGARIRVYTISIIGGLGLIGQAIYFLIVTSTRSTPINYASLSILLVLEIIPALLFIFVESIAKPTKRSSKGSGKNGKSTKSTKSGSGIINSNS